MLNEERYQGGRHKRQDLKLQRNMSSYLPPLTLPASSLLLSSTSRFPGQTCYQGTFRSHLRLCGKGGLQMESFCQKETHTHGPNRRENYENPVSIHQASILCQPWLTIRNWDEAGINHELNAVLKGEMLGRMGPFIQSQILNKLLTWNY